MDTKDMRPIGTIDSIVFHHTGNSQEYPINRILQIQVGNTGWAAIGYHYVINEEGLIINTRPLKYEGAQVYGKNPGKIGIAFSANLNKQGLNPSMAKAYIDLLEYLQEKYNISNENIYGHFQLKLSRIEDIIRKVLPDFQGIDTDAFLTARNAKAFRKLKRKEVEQIINLVRKNDKKKKELKTAISMLRSTYSCPGVNFYKNLQEARAGDR
jgi:hypothetical protein